MARAFLFPGQGSQKPGMGAELFDRHPDLVAEADAVLGYSIRELCLDGSTNSDRLRRTEFVQPAMFVVNALTHADRGDHAPAADYLAGHSLGEYNALVAAGSLGFGDGLRLVARRGALMAACPPGSMLAVLGAEREAVVHLAAGEGLHGIDLANHNGLTQLVVAGPKDEIRAFADAVRARGLGKAVPLNVSIPAHSRHMAPATEEFADLLRQVEFREPALPVVANATARPHERDGIVAALTDHLVRPVLWWDTLCLLSRRGVDDVVELGPGDVLTKLWLRARPDLPGPESEPETEPETAPEPEPAPVPVPRVPVVDGGTALGSATFREAWGVRHAYLPAPLDHGVSGPAMLRRLAGAGLAGVLGTAGRTPEEVEGDIADLDGVRYAVQLPIDPPAGVRLAVASGARGVTHDLVAWRFGGEGRRLLVTCDRLDRATALLRPAPAPIVERLRAAGRLDAAQARRAVSLPVATDLAVEGWAVLLPAVRELRDAAARDCPEPLHVGASGGLGTPEAIAAAFLAGADFVVTGALNACTPEARTSDRAKVLLAAAGPDDTVEVPGEADGPGTVRVLRRGSLHAGRVAALADDGAEAVRRYAREAALAAVTGAGHENDLRIPCDPAVGAHNRWAAGNGLGDLRARHVDVLADRLMSAAGELSSQRISEPAQY